MLNVNDEVKRLLMENYRQMVRIRFPNTIDGVTKMIEIRESELTQNSFRWDRYCATGDMLEIGSAVSAEIEFTLRNTDGYFFDTGGNKISTSDISFEGKELTVEIGTQKWGARRWENAQEYWFNIGKFTIMNMPHKFSTIQISALDRMTWFDMYPVTEGNNAFSRLETLHSIVEKMCGVLNIQFVFSSTLPNYDMVVDIEKLLEEVPDLTYRQLVQWIAAFTGTCAYINAAGDLVFRWVETVENVRITPHYRYSSTVYEPVQFTSLLVEKGEDSARFGANDGYYSFLISDNSLIQGDKWVTDYTIALESVWDKLSAATPVYCPFDASTIPFPYLEPLDVIEYEDNDGSVFHAPITHITYTLNGSTSISAVGQSETEANCITPSGGRTSRESADIKALKDRIAYLENATQTARNNLTDMVRMALGLRAIPVTTSDGGIIYYFTTAEISDGEATLAELSQVIKPTDVVYCFSSEGWVWCNGDNWNKETHEPFYWKNGITKDGTAVLGLINATGIHVADVDTNYRTEITPESYAVYKDANLVFGFNGQLESQVNRLLVKSNIIDSTLENNAYIRLGSAMLVPAEGGLDIVYVEDI